MGRGYAPPTDCSMPGVEQHQTPSTGEILPIRD